MVAHPPSASDLPLFPFSSFHNVSTPIAARQVEVAEGRLAWPGLSSSSAFAVLAGLVQQHEVESMIGLLNTSSLQFDTDEDSVDGMMTHEFYLERYQSLRPRMPSKPESGNRDEVRDALAEIARPILQERITPYVRDRYKCPTCTPCFSLVRRYRDLERSSAASGTEGHTRSTGRPPPHDHAPLSGARDGARLAQHAPDAL
jgi:hypothetical protein